MSLFAELKRRNVFRVGIAYVVVAWVLLQLTEVLTELLEIGPEVGKIVIVLLIVGFIPALIFAWAFELTPEGIKKESEVDRSQSIRPQTGRKLDRTIIAVLVLGLSYFIWESRLADDQVADSDTTETPALGDPESGITDEAERSVAVLPFVNMSSDPEQEYFSDGITEEIINAVVKIPGLSVPARTSVFGYKGHQGDIRAVGRELGVAHVLEGSIRSQGDQVRITAQLIKVDDGFHMWSETYNRRLENIFAVQEEIATAIATVLVGELGVDVATVPNQTRNMEAYDLYLQGRALLRTRDEGSLAFFEQAIEADPEFAPAYAALAIALQSTNLDAPRSAEMAERALELDPLNVIALDVKASLLRRELNWVEAEKVFDQAMAIDPANAELLEDYAEFLNYVGRTNEALVITTRGMRIDPLLGPLAMAHAEALASNGQLDQARELAISIVKTNPGQGWLWWFAVPLWLDPENPDIVGIPDESTNFDWGSSSTYEAHAKLIKKHIDTGLTSEDIEELKSNLEGLGEVEYRGQELNWRTAREILVLAGEYDAVINGEQTFMRHIRRPPHEMQWTPFFAGLRQYPRFQEYLEAIGLIDYWDATAWPHWCQRDSEGVITCI